MNLPYYFSPLTVALALGVALPLHAAQPIMLQKTSFSKIQQQFLLFDPITAHNNSTTVDRLKVISQHTDKNKTTHTRMQQYYAGFPVIGGYAIIHQQNQAQGAANTKNATQMNGTIYDGLVSELGQPAPVFAVEAPAVLNTFKKQYSTNNVSEEESTPVVFIDQDNNAHWAYKVSLFVEHDDKIPERPTAIIDAQSKKILVQWDNIKTATTSVKGVGFGGNKKIGEYQFGKDLPLLDITRDTITERCYMETKEVKVIDMQHKYSSKNTPMTFNCTNGSEQSYNTYFTGYNADGYDSYNGAASPSNDAMYDGYVIKHLYHDWYGIEVLTQADGKPMQLVLRVHYGSRYENAYWDGRQMTFGDGDSVMYPLVSLGVGAHEVSHGFTEQHSSLEYYGQSGGMNESFSDMAAQAAEYYSVGKVSWTIGAEIMKEESGYEALRFMDRPSRDRRSIDSADEYYNGLDVHYSSGVFNRLFYLLANQSGWNVRQAFDVMVKANMDYWTPYSSFEEGGCGVLYAAKDLGYSLTDVSSALTAVAIKQNNCSLS